MGRPQSTLAALLLCVVVVSTRLAHAAPPPPTTTTPTTTASANQHFQHGVELYDAADYPAALAAFKKAYEVAPDFRVLYNIGQASYQTKQYAASRSALRRYLDDGGERVPADRRRRVEANLTDLDNLVGRVRASVDVAGARVFVDGVLVGTAPLPDVVIVDPGRHEVRAEVEGRPPVQATVEVASAREAQITLQFPAAAPIATTPSREAGARSSPSLVGPILLGAGGVTLVGALVFDFGLVRGKLDDFEELRNRDDPAAGDARQSASTLQTVTLVTYAVGVVLACAGAAITFWPKRTQAQQAQQAVKSNKSPLQFVF